MSINNVSTHNIKKCINVKISPNNLDNHHNYFLLLENFVVVEIVVGLSWSGLLLG